MSPLYERQIDRDQTIETNAIDMKSPIVDSNVIRDDRLSQSLDTSFCVLSTLDSFSDQITQTRRVIRVIRRNNHLPVSRQRSFFKK